jgi:hypothetical protein
MAHLDIGTRRRKRSDCGTGDDRDEKESTHGEFHVLITPWFISLTAGAVYLTQKIVAQYPK